MCVCFPPSNSELQEGRGHVCSIFATLPAPLAVAQWNVLIELSSNYDINPEEKEKHPTKRNHRSINEPPFNEH